MSSNDREFGDIAERFMEMGMGMNMAGQMSHMMNQAMAQTMQSPAQNPAQNPKGDPRQLYYAAIDGKQAGPFSETEIVRLINDGRLTRETFVWHEGMNQWKAAQDVPEILRIIILTPPTINS